MTRYDLSYQKSQGRASSKTCFLIIKLNSTTRRLWDFKLEMRKDKWGPWKFHKCKMKE